MNPLSFLLDLLALVVGVVAGYLFHRYQADKAAKAQHEKADNVLKVASEQARLIDKQARDSATKIVQASEMEIKERRLELNRETDRLEKRRKILALQIPRQFQHECADRHVFRLAGG